VIETLIGVAPQGTEESFYRTSAGAEMDLVLTLPGDRLWAIEIKRTLSPKLNRGFHQAYKDLNPDQCFVVYPGSERFPLSPGVKAINLVDLSYALLNA
jgi:predicted AAA+ superfamily ATPase